MNTDDVSAFDIPAEPPANALEPLLKLATEGLTLDDEIAGLESLLKTKTGRLHELRMTVIPEAMAAAGLSSFRTPEGKTVEVDTFVSGSIPKEPERRKVALEALVEFGGGDLIKTLVAINFGKSEHNEAIALADDIRKAGFEPVVDESVHAQSLMAFVREKLAAGENFDPSKIGVFVGKKANFIIPKEPKAKKPRAAKGAK